MPIKGIICIILVVIGLTIMVNEITENAIEYLDDKIVQKISHKQNIRWHLIPCPADHHCRE